MQTNGCYHYNCFFSNMSVNVGYHISITTTTTKKQQTHLTALNPGEPEWASIRNVQFIFSSWITVTLIASVAPIPFNPFPPFTPSITSVGFTCSTPHRSQARTNWEGRNRKGSWHKTGGCGGLFWRLFSRSAWQPEMVLSTQFLPPLPHSNKIQKHNMAIAFPCQTEITSIGHH